MIDGGKTKGDWKVIERWLKGNWVVLSCIYKANWVETECDKNQVVVVEYCQVPTWVGGRSGLCAVLYICHGWLKQTPVWKSIMTKSHKASGKRSSKPYLSRRPRCLWETELSRRGEAGCVTAACVGKTTRVKTHARMGHLQPTAQSREYHHSVWFEHGH